MANTIIKLENVSKQYRLGTVDTFSLHGDIKRWFARVRGKEDPFLQIGQENILDKITKNKNGEYVWALKDINLEVKEGEVLGIIGKNGAGKSTLLKLMSRVTAPTTGNIKIKGRIASLLEVGTGFHPELTGKENIYLNGAILGMTKREINGKFDEIVEFAGVEKYIDTPVKRYSSGMYVRLAFAVAAHLDPDILIVDEVLAVGDAEFQKKALKKMEDVSKGQGRKILFVSHNLQSVRQLCTEGMLLKNGVIDSIDSINHVLNLYKTSLKNVSLKTNALINYNDNRRNTGHIKFTAVSINDINNVERFEFLIGESIRFTMAFEVFEEISGIAATVVFYSSLTKEIVTSIRHIVTKDILYQGEKGKITLELTDNNFRPGEYPLYLYISEAADRPLKYDVLDDMIHPLIILADKTKHYDHFNPLTPMGFFSVNSSEVVEYIIQ
jgi:lipopolysaccharide transport system ATP-binding protein